MKDTFYFQHDYDARQDKKIVRLMAKHGMRGYGIFWAIIENLYSNANALQTDYESIAYLLHEQSDIVESVIKDFDLFVFEGDVFGSTSIEARLNERNEKSGKARESANKRWQKYREENANVMRTQSEGNAIKERKGKEKKENISPTNVVDNEAAKAVDLEFEEIWKTYRRKTGKQDALAKWKKLKPKERDMVRAHVPRYMEQKKDSEVKYIKEFSTYLNKKAWMDEISEEQEITDNAARWKAKLAELKSRQTVIEVTTDPTKPTYKIMEYHNGKGMSYIAGVERMLEGWLQQHWELIPLVKEVEL